MELDVELNLAEVAMQLSTSVEKLIQFGAHGDLTISVIANEWQVRAEGGTVNTISGLVNLVPEDLLQSYVADTVIVNKIVAANENEVMALAESVELRRGPLFVTGEEFRRFRNKFGSVADRTEEVPPYLDPSHRLKSPLLAIAIEAWLALFSDGSFDPSGRAVKQRIDEWLLRHHGNLSTNSREKIATLINPEIYKDGGTPRTPGQ